MPPAQLGRRHEAAMHGGAGGWGGAAMGCGREGSRGGDRAGLGDRAGGQGGGRVEVIRLGAWSQEGEEGDLACLGQGTGRCRTKGLNLLKLSTPKKDGEAVSRQPGRLHSHSVTLARPQLLFLPPEPQSGLPRPHRAPLSVCLPRPAQGSEDPSSHGLAAGLGARGSSGGWKTPW